MFKWHLCTFGMAFNRPLQDVLLPAALCELHFGNRFDQALDGIRWPSQLRLLHFGSDFNHSLATANLPDQLETLVLGRFFQQDLRLPQSLLRLTLGECFPLERHPLFWPPYLEELSIKRLFLKVPVDVTFPETMRKHAQAGLRRRHFGSVAERSKEEERSAVLPAFATPRCIPVARTAVLLACPCSFRLSGQQDSKTRAAVLLTRS